MVLVNTGECVEIAVHLTSIERCEWMLTVGVAVITLMLARFVTIAFSRCLPECWSITGEFVLALVTARYIVESGRVVLLRSVDEL